MSTHIYDIDGTLVNYHTGEWLPGAFERLQRVHAEGHDIILITMRGLHDHGKPWSIENTKRTILADLERAGIQYRIMFDVQPHRILFDDTPPEAVHHPANTSW